MCHFKNVAVLQDEFVHLVISLVSSLLPAYWSFLMLVSGSHKIPIYHYCVGSEAVGRLLGQETLCLQKLLAILTAACVTSVYAMTRLHERKTEAAIAASPTTLYANVSLHEAKVI